ncbi:hypothetical protein BFW01_g11788 [Lasiodiplodia theobromae]|nr:hypothetical protein BFW01_g11788 [Lasiodiplodia theobromae]
MEDDRLVRRLGSGHAGEVFEAVIGGRVYALKLYTSLDEHSSEKKAYAKLNKALTSAKAKITSKSTTDSAMARLLIIINSFCQEQDICAVETLLENYSGPTNSCFLSQPVEKYCRLGMRLEMIHGPTLDDKDDSGTGAVTTVLKTEGQKRRVWQRLRDALGWLHRKAEMLHGSVHGRNVILVRVRERVGKVGDGDEEEEEAEAGVEEEEGQDQEYEDEEEDEVDYMPILIDFNHVEWKKDHDSGAAWIDACTSELNSADALLPMVALKDMVASQGRIIKSNHYCRKRAKAFVCGTCFICLKNRLSRLRKTVDGLWGDESLKYARGSEEIVQPILVDALHVVTDILEDIELSKAPYFHINLLKHWAWELAEPLLRRVLDDLPCAGDEVFKTALGCQ